MKERELQESFTYLCEVERANFCAGITDIRNIKSKLNQICEERFREAQAQAGAEKHIFGEQPTRRALAGDRKLPISKETNAYEFDLFSLLIRRSQKRPLSGVIRHCSRPPIAPLVPIYLVACLRICLNSLRKEAEI